MAPKKAAAKAAPAPKAAAKPAPAPAPAAKKPAEKAAKVAKAQTAAKVAKKAITKKQSKVRKNVHFFRPKTLKLARKPMYPRKSVTKQQVMDKFRIIKYPLTTESAMKKAYVHLTQNYDALDIANRIGVI